MQDRLAADVTSAVQELTDARPELHGARPAVLGSGLDHHAYLVGDHVLRLRGEDDDAEDFTRESALLALVARRCPVPVPAPTVARPSWIAYPLLHGTPLLELDPALRTRHAEPVAAVLGAVLAELWATPLEAVAGLAEDDDAPLAEWRDEAAELVADLAPEVPHAARPGLDRFLQDPLPAPARKRVFTHNDLGCEHVLVEPATGRVTGILDWSDAAVADPAKDLGLVLRDLGPAAFELALRTAGPALPAPGDLASRAAFYARCLALEDLAFGLETGQARYAESARAALVRLLATGAA